MWDLPLTAFTEHTFDVDLNKIHEENNRGYDKKAPQLLFHPDAMDLWFGHVKKKVADASYDNPKYWYWKNGKRYSSQDEKEKTNV